MKALLTFIAILMLSGCAGVPGVGDEFSRYCESFRAKVAADIPAVSVQFGIVEDAPAGLVRAGECHQASWNKKVPEIRISRSVWGRLSEAQRERLVWHELGHCALGLPHQPTGFMKERLDE